MNKLVILRNHLYLNMINKIVWKSRNLEAFKTIADKYLVIGLSAGGALLLIILVITVMTVARRRYGKK